MYNPPSFREERVPVLHDLIRAHGLATLVTLDARRQLVASHLPMEIDPEPSPYGTLRGHLARANPQWTTLDGQVDALAIFHGPQAYVSPAWYPTKQAAGQVVPTWNYAVVHASGPLRVVDDPAWLRALVGRLTDRHEAGRAHPWHVEDAPESFLRGLLRSIVGVELPIASIEGKWKLSQNRPEVDRLGVIAGLRASGDPAAAAVAVEMEGRR